jgi:hypothetical protein
LIDNQVELESLVESINKSKSYVYLTQIEFDPDFVATFTTDNFDEVNPKDILVDVLQKAALSS